MIAYKAKEYKIVQEDNRIILEMEVNKLLEEGWWIAGNLTKDRLYFYQSMIKMIEDKVW